MAMVHDTVCRRDATSILKNITFLLQEQRRLLLQETTTHSTLTDDILHSVEQLCVSLEEDGLFEPARPFRELLAPGILNSLCCSSPWLQKLATETLAANSTLNSVDIGVLSSQCIETSATAATSGKDLLIILLPSSALPLLRSLRTDSNRRYSFNTSWVANGVHWELTDHSKQQNDASSSSSIILFGACMDDSEAKFSTCSKRSPEDVLAMESITSMARSARSAYGLVGVSLSSMSSSNEFQNLLNFLDNALNIFKETHMIDYALFDSASTAGIGHSFADFPDKLRFYMKLHPQHPRFEELLTLFQTSGGIVIKSYTSRDLIDEEPREHGDDYYIDTKTAPPSLVHRFRATQRGGSPAKHLTHEKIPHSAETLSSLCTEHSCRGMVLLTQQDMWQLAKRKITADVPCIHLSPEEVLDGLSPDYYSARSSASSLFSSTNEIEDAIRALEVKLHFCEQLCKARLDTFNFVGVEPLLDQLDRLRPKLLPPKASARIEETYTRMMQATLDRSQELQGILTRLSVIDDQQMRTIIDAARKGSLLSEYWTKKLSFKSVSCALVESVSFLERDAKEKFLGFLKTRSFDDLDDAILLARKVDCVQALTSPNHQLSYTNSLLANIEEHIGTIEFEGSSCYNMFFMLSFAWAILKATPKTTLSSVTIASSPFWRQFSDFLRVTLGVGEIAFQSVYGARTAPLVNDCLDSSTSTLCETISKLECAQGAFNTLSPRAREVLGSCLDTYSGMIHDFKDRVSKGLSDIANELRLQLEGMKSVEQCLVPLQRRVQHICWLYKPYQALQVHFTSSQGSSLTDALKEQCKYHAECLVPALNHIDVSLDALSCTSITDTSVQLQSKGLLNVDSQLLHHLQALSLLLSSSDLFGFSFSVHHLESAMKRLNERADREVALLRETINSLLLSPCSDLSFCKKARQRVINSLYVSKEIMNVFISMRCALGKVSVGGVLEPIISSSSRSLDLTLSSIDPTIESMRNEALDDLSLLSKPAQVNHQPTTEEDDGKDRSAACIMTLFQLQQIDFPGSLGVVLQDSFRMVEQAIDVEGWQACEELTSLVKQLTATTISCCINTADISNAGIDRVACDCLHYLTFVRKMSDILWDTQNTCFWDEFEKNCLALELFAKQLDDTVIALPDSFLDGLVQLHVLTLESLVPFDEHLGYRLQRVPRSALPIRFLFQSVLRKIETRAAFGAKTICDSFKEHLTAGYVGAIETITQLSCLQRFPSIKSLTAKTLQRTILLHTEVLQRSSSSSKYKLVADCNQYVPACIDLLDCCQSLTSFIELMRQMSAVVTMSLDQATLRCQEMLDQLQAVFRKSTQSTADLIRASMAMYEVVAVESQLAQLRRVHLFLEHSKQLSLCNDLAVIMSDLEKDLTRSLGAMKQRFSAMSLFELVAADIPLASVLSNLHSAGRIDGKYACLAQEIRGIVLDNVRSFLCERAARGAGAPNNREAVVRTRVDEDDLPLQLVDEGDVHLQSAQAQALPARKALALRAVRCLPASIRDMLTLEIDDLFDDSF